MKPLCILVFAAMLPQTLNAQLTRKDNFLSELRKDSTVADTLTADQREFDYAYELWDEQPLMALTAFKGFIEQYPDSPLLPRAKFNLGSLQFRFGQDSAAYATLTEVLEGDYNERDENSLMEPYALYKHRACRILAELSLRRHEFGEAARYVHMFDEVYPYQHFCGNEWQAYHYYRDWMKARIKEGTGEFTEAIQILVPDIVYTGLAGNGYIIEYLDKILNEHYSTDQIRAEVRRGLDTASFKKRKGQTTTIVTMFGARVTFGVYDDVKSNQFIAKYKP